MGSALPRAPAAPNTGDPSFCHAPAPASAPAQLLHAAFASSTRLLHAAARSAAAAAAGPELNPPPCIFKKYNFTADPPPETKYIFAKVPTCEPDLSGSVLLRPSTRRQWFVCLKELESLAQESLDRRAARLQLTTPSGLPLVYIADRMDIDDPLWGYQIRCSKTGWLQGFITLTVFTTWTHYFEWNSLAPASGMAAARVANAMIGKDDPAIYFSDGGETVQQVAARFGVRAVDIVSWNSGRYTSISCNSRVQPGTMLYVMDPAMVDTMAVSKPGETPKKLAARLGLDTDDLLQLNSEKHPSLLPTSKLKPGLEIICRDRSAEPDVFLPTNAQERQLDEDGSIAAALQQQQHFGDPVTTGVVWPRLVELGLLAGLGCGKLLVKLALQELTASGEFDYAVLQATMASVSFYEELGFVRVGAVARYLPEGTALEDNPVHGYRHWAASDEAHLDQFGDTSYMMAIKLKGLKTGSTLKVLEKRLVKDWPAVQPGFGKGAGKGHGKKSSTGNTAGIVGGEALQVGDMSLNMADGDDARLQLRFEIDRVLDERGSGSGLEYFVKWKHCAVDDATWESAQSDCIHSEVGQAVLNRYLKSHHKKGLGGHSSPHVGSHHGEPGSRKRAALAALAEGPPHGPWWARKVVRAKPEAMPVPLLAGPRIFRGGLGEQPELLNAYEQQQLALQQEQQAALQQHGTLEKEHRYWYVLRYVASTTKCTLVPLLAGGRFGGCGRRAGRVRWKPAPLKQGYEREAMADTLLLVAAESIQSAREQDSNAWVIDDQDAEHAAREQAAAARNKKRKLIVEEGQASGVLPNVYLSMAPRRPSESGVKRERPAGVRPARAEGVMRKKKRLAPASRSCLACTKGKHSAHTCGVRGKEIEEALKARKAEALAKLAAGPNGHGSLPNGSPKAA